MCDTIVALPEVTADGAVLFGKNSDRERNEAQSVEFVPRAEHAPGAKVACTYIAIPRRGAPMPPCCAGRSGCGAPRWAPTSTAW